MATRILSLACWLPLVVGQGGVPDGGFSLGGGMPSNEVKCWGLDDVGQSSPPQGMPFVFGVSAGAQHTVAWTITGEVYCWGLSTACVLPAITGSVEGACAGESHSCAWTSSSVYCWGVSNQHRQHDVPSGLPPIGMMACGANHNCAMTAGGEGWGGEIVCWGNDDQGQSSPPIGLNGTAWIAAGYQHSCAVLESDGSVVCWGDNSNGQATAPSYLSRPIFVAAGDHTCATTLSQPVHGSNSPQAKVSCWGPNDQGQTNVPDVGDKHLLGVSAWKGSTCALLITNATEQTTTADAEVLCWGLTNFAVPTGLTKELRLDVMPLAHSQNHLCVITTSVTTTSTTASSSTVTTATRSTTTYTSRTRTTSTRSTTTYTSRTYTTTIRTTTTLANPTTTAAVVAAESTAAVTTAATVPATTATPESTATTTMAATTTAPATTTTATAPATTTAATTAAADAATTAAWSASTTVAALPVATTNGAEATSMGSTGASSFGAATSTAIAETLTTTVALEESSTGEATSTGQGMSPSATSTSAALPTASTTFATPPASTTTLRTTPTPGGSSTPESAVVPTTTTATAVAASSSRPAAAVAATTEGAATAGTAPPETSTSAEAAPAGGGTATTALAGPVSTAAASAAGGDGASTSEAAAVDGGPASASSTTAPGTTTGVAEATTAGPTPAPPPQVAAEQMATPQEVAEEAKEQEGDLIQQVKNVSAPPTAPVVLRLPGVVQTGFQLPAAKAVNNVTNWTVAVEGTAAVIEIPVEVLDAAQTSGEEEGVIFVISVVETPVTDEPKDQPTLDERGKAFRAAGLMTASLYTLQGVRLPVSNVAKPIVLTLPVNHTSGLQCAFWDETSRVWSEKGVTTVSRPTGESLRCATTHLTLFAGIWTGFITTLLCTNLELLSLAGLRELLIPSWLLHPIVIAYIVVLAVIAAMFIVAAIMDRRRATAAIWRDEQFLIPVGKRPKLLTDGTGSASTGGGGIVAELSRFSFGAKVERQGSQGSLVDDRHSVSSLDSASERVGSATKAAFCSCVNWCRTSSVLRDAIDDILSRWFTYFSEVRDLVESIWDGLGVDQGDEDEEEERPRGVLAVAQGVLGSVLSNSAKRQAAAAMGLSTEVVHFLIEDQTLNELLQEAATLAIEGDLDLPWKQKMLHWLYLHDEVVRRIDEKWHQHSSWCAIPRVAAKLFHSINPFVLLFNNCHFYTCSQRVLFWSCNLLGSVMVATLFFKATTVVRGKRSRQACSALVNSAWEELGRLIAITLVSLVLAHIPVGVLGSLHHRSLKKLAAEGCPKWERQLRVWKTQDRLLWAMGLPYLLFSALFILLFLANVAATEIPNWAVTGLLTLLEEFVFVPFGIALFVPSITMAMLSLVCWLKGTDRVAILRQRRIDRECRSGSTWYEINCSI